MFRTFVTQGRGPSLGAEVPVIPSAVAPSPSTRTTPFIYSQADLDALLTACPSVFGGGPIRPGGSG
jgi:hypothetical protein